MTRGLDARMMNPTLAESFANLAPALTPQALTTPSWNECDAIREFVRQFRSATDRERRAIYRMVRVGYSDALMSCSQTLAESAFRTRERQALVDSLIVLALGGYHTPSRFETRALDMFLPLPFDVAARIGLDAQLLADEAAASLPGRSSTVIRRFPSLPARQQDPAEFGWRPVVDGANLTFQTEYHW